MTRILTILMLLFSVALSGQNAPLGYTIVKNKPDEVSYVNIGIDPLFYQLDGRSGRLYYNPFVTVMVHNRLVLDLTYTRSYVKMKGYDAASTNGSYANPENGIKHFSNFTAIGKYYALKYVAPHKETIKIRINRKTDHKIPATVNVCNMWGLRGGVSVVKQQVDGEYTNISGYYVNDPGHTNILFAGGYNTMADYTLLSLGLSFCRVRDMVLNIDGHGEVKRYWNEELYFDIHRVMKCTFDNMIGSQPSAINVTDISKADWGFKVGWMNSMNNRLGLNFGLEAGLNTIPVYTDQTGIRDRLFLNYRMGFAFAQRFK